MRLLRAAAIAVFALAVVLAAAAAVAIHNQARLISLVLAHIEQRTGYRIVAQHAWLHFGPHLGVYLEHPIIEHDGRRLMRSDRVRVYLSYHALIWSNGLPVRALEIVRPELRVPPAAGSLGLATLPRPDGAMVGEVVEKFRDFTGLLERLTIAGASIRDDAGRPLLDDFSMTAAPRRRHGAIWNIGFIAPRIYDAPSGLEVSGRMSVFTAARDSAQVVSTGELWFWNGRVTDNPGAGVALSGTAHGDATFALTGGGNLSGRVEVAADRLAAGGARLSRPIQLGDCLLRAIYAVSATRVTLANIEARSGAATIASGDLTLNDPFAPDASILAHLSPTRIDLATIKSWLGAARTLPQPMAWLAAALISGHLALEGATYQAAVKDIAWNTAALSHALQVTAELEAMSFKLPDAPALGAFSQINAQISFANGRFAVAQGSAYLGRSALREIGGTVELPSGRRPARYQLKAAATLDLDELYPAALRLSPALAARTAGHVDAVTGSAAVQASASGNFNPASPAPPAKYLVKIEPSGLQLSDRDLPVPIALVGGSVTITPREIELRRVMAAVARPKAPGAVTVNGALGFDSRGPRLRQIAVELHQIEVQEWLPLVLDPKDIAARGPLGGSLAIVRATNRSGGIRANGRLTMGASEIQLGFLRAPIVAESATLSFDGRGLLLAIVGARLQGAPFDFSFGVADLDHPVVRIVANAARLDLEVMKFIRLPWAPSPPAHFFPVPVTGHLEAAHANLERLTMTRARCDFRREINGDWAVRNFVANMYEGRAEMEFSGRGRDDWINVKGRMDGVLVGPLLGLADPAAQPPLSGRLKLSGDLWADSDTDFFNTLAGTVSVEVTDGVLHKFAMLSRILSYIDLKSWLSARIPDPRINGVPFQTLTAEFKGRDGDFYSDDLLLRGPVMNISALGHVRLADSNVNMEVGMVPFKTVNWLMGKVPLIGHGLSSDHFVAAYFHVTGPLNNPHVVPKPISSVAYFLTNVLKLPYNILKSIGNGGNAN